MGLVIRALLTHLKKGQTSSSDSGCCEGNRTGEAAKEWRCPCCFPSSKGGRRGERGQKTLVSCIGRSRGNLFTYEQSVVRYNDCLLFADSIVTKGGKEGGRGAFIEVVK